MTKQQTLQLLHWTTTGKKTKLCLENSTGRGSCVIIMTLETHIHIHKHVKTNRLKTTRNEAT